MKGYLLCKSGGKACIAQFIPPLPHGWLSKKGHFKKRKESPQWLKQTIFGKIKKMPCKIPRQTFFVFVSGLFHAKRHN
jgi:hypothetical protein